MSNIATTDRGIDIFGNAQSINNHIYILATTRRAKSTLNTSCLSRLQKLDKSGNRLNLIVIHLTIDLLLLAIQSIKTVLCNNLITDHHRKDLVAMHTIHLQRHRLKQGKTLALSILIEGCKMVRQIIHQRTIYIEKQTF